MIEEMIATEKIVTGTTAIETTVTVKTGTAVTARGPRQGGTLMIVVEKTMSGSLQGTMIIDAGVLMIPEDLTPILIMIVVGMNLNDEGNDAKTRRNVTTTGRRGTTEIFDETF